jgi:orotidine-5'-phosphate decarboxylase
MEKLVTYIDGRNITIADGKRGDIGNTTQKYAISIFDTIGFDSITVSPYMGSDSIIPFIQNKEKGAFVLCLTSNDSAKEIQLFSNENDTIYQFISRLGDSLNTNNNIGLVVGATNPSFMEKIRETNSLPWLIPGIGAQGGDLEQSVTISNKNNSIGLINVSRGIIFAGNCSVEDITDAAESYNDNINGYS